MRSMFPAMTIAGGERGDRAAARRPASCRPHWSAPTTCWLSAPSGCWKDEGIRVPDDMALVGYDDVDFARSLVGSVDHDPPGQVPARRIRPPNCCCASCGTRTTSTPRCSWPPSWWSGRRRWDAADRHRREGRGARHERNRAACPGCGRPAVRQLQDRGGVGRDGDGQRDLVAVGMPVDRQSAVRGVVVREQPVEPGIEVRLDPRLAITRTDRLQPGHSAVEPVVDTAERVVVERGGSDRPVRRDRVPGPPRSWWRPC